MLRVFINSFKSELRPSLTSSTNICKVHEFTIQILQKSRMKNESGHNSAQLHICDPTGSLGSHLKQDKILKISIIMP